MIESGRPTRSRRRWSARDIPDQSGRTAVVTGANSGLGLVVADALARRGARVLLACRDPHRADTAVRHVRRSVQQAGGDPARAELIILDLADLTRVRAAADAIRSATGDRLDLLINNAGVMAPPRRTSAHGAEYQFGVNHLGHAALTWLLGPALRAADHPRVVTVSSLLHRRATIDFDDLEFRHGYRPMTAYGRSKLANLLFTAELDRRATAAGLPLIAVAAHPGYAATDLLANYLHTRRVPRPLARALTVPAQLTAQSAAHGALPLLYAATAAGVRGGDYVGPAGPGQLRGGPAVVRAAPRAYDEQAAARLWAVTAALTGVAPDPA